MLIGLLLDRYKTRRILFFIFLSTGLATIGLSLAKNFWVLVTMLILQETFSFAFFPVALTAIAKVTGTNERSTFTGATMGISVMIGLGLSPVILGAIADSLNFQTGIFFLGLCISLSCIFPWWLNDI